MPPNSFTHRVIGRHGNPSATTTPIQANGLLRPAIHRAGGDCSRSVMPTAVRTASSVSRREQARAGHRHGPWTCVPSLLLYLRNGMLSSRRKPGLKERDMIRDKSDPPRSVLHVRPSELAGVARYWPSPDLEPFIEDYWVARWDRTETAETVPQPCTHIVLQAGASEVVGVARTRFTRRLTGRGRMLGAKFRPGTFRVFRDVPAWQFAGRALPLADMFGPVAGNLEARALASDDDRESLPVVEDFLRGLQPSSNESMALVGRIVARVADDRGITRVGQLEQE